MQRERAQFQRYSTLATPRLLSTKCIVRAVSRETRCSKPSKNFSQSILEFFNDITEGARDAPRRSLEDVPDDVADLAAKVYHAADEVTSAAKNLRTDLSALDSPLSTQQDEQLQITAQSDLIQQGVQTLDQAASDLQLRVRSGAVTAAAAFDMMMIQFSQIISSITANDKTSTRSSSRDVQAAVNKSRVQAATCVAMVLQAAQQQHISDDQAVQKLNNLLKSLLTDMAAVVTDSGTNTQAPPDIHTTRTRGMSGAFATAVTAADATANPSIGQANSVGVPEGLSPSLALSIEAAAKAIVEAETIAASLQLQLPALEQKLKTAAKAAKGKKQSHEAAARVFSVIVDQLIDQISVYALSSVSLGLSSVSSDDLKAVAAAALAATPSLQDAGPAAAALKQLCEALDAKGRQLAVQIEAGKMKSSQAVRELLKFLQAEVSGQLRSSLLDGLLSQSSTASSSSSSEEATPAAVYDSSTVAVQLGAAIAETRKQQIAAGAAGAAGSAVEGVFKSPAALGAWLVKAAVGIASLHAIKTAASTLMEKMGVAFPGALAGMLGVTAVLLALGKQAAQPLLQYYEQYVSWTATVWPLMYVPVLATVPTLLHGTDMRALVGISLAGAATSLLFAAAVANALLPKANLTSATAAAAVCAGPRAPLLTAPNDALRSSHGALSQESAPGNSNAALLLSGTALVAVLSLALTKFDPVGLGSQMVVPVGIAWTLLGWLTGRALHIKPMVLGAIAAKLGVYWHGKLMGLSYLSAMGTYFGQGDGAGELLVSLLGIPLTGLGFVIYKNRRHINLPAVVGTAVASLAFVVASTVAAARLTSMSDVWTKALVTRSITAGVATDVGRLVNASPECTAIAALLQAAIIVKLGGLLLKLTGDANSAASGIAAGCTAGGIGVAAVAKDEPIALANGILAYAIVHMLSTVAVHTPAVGRALQTAVRLAAV